MAVERRQCSKCGINRALKFFPPDRRRLDGVSTVCRPCRKKKQQSWDRNTRLQVTYGITEEEYRQLLAAQDGRCAICKGKRPGNLDVDHDHKTNVIRGLLCRRCNRRLLPAATDRVEVLEGAIRYLEDPPAVRELGVRICP